MASLASSSALPNGIYGISPTSFQLKYSNKAGLSNLVVYSTSTSGVDTKLSTNFNTGKVSGLTPNTFYMLTVRGILPNGAETPNALASYNIQSWNTFTNETFSLVGATSAPSTLSLNGSAYNVKWTYTPWKTVPAGDGVRAATTMRCFFVADKGPSTDPFVDGAAHLDAPVEAQAMPVSAGAINLAGNVRVGCEVIYADGTVSRANQTQLTLLIPAMTPCPSKSVDVYTPYTCSTADLLGATGAGSGLVISLDSTNTCTWLKVDAAGITGVPHDPAVGSCTLAYKVTSPSGVSSPILNAALTVKNTKPVWVKTPGPLKAMRETSRNDPGTLVSGGFSMPSLLTNSAYTLHMVDQFQTNKAAYGVVDSAVYGSYRIDSTIESNCASKGDYYYPNAAGTMVSGINPTTGEFYFQPYEYVYGSCTIAVYFDDGHVENNLSDQLKIVASFKGFNDPPSVVDPGFPVTGPNGTPLNDCGSNCYLNIDYFVSLQANTGGINEAHRTITGELDQKIFVKPGNCIAQNNPASDPNVYVKIVFCQLDPDTGNVLVGFMPIALPTNGTYVSIKTVVSDDAISTLQSAFNPVVSGENSKCLAQTGCKSFPNSNGDSAVVSFSLKLAQFDMPIQPALVVSKGACLACHLTVSKGDFVTDMGNTPPGAKSRFPNTFFNGDIGSTSSHIEGYRSINQLAGNFYVKRSTLTPTTNSAWYAVVGGLSSQSGASYSTPLAGTPSVDLLDFLSSWNWTYGGSRYSDDYVRQNNAFVSICPGPYVQDIGSPPKQCSPASIRDTVQTATGTKPINFLTISAPTPTDIQSIASLAPGQSSKIDWGGPNAAVAPLYLIPTDTSVQARPFSGLVVSNKQPASAVLPGQAAKTTNGTFVTNNGPIVCYGDVAVKGDLFLEAPAFVSDSRGCRIHVTGSVILHAKASSDANNPALGNTITGTGNVGVQISSSVGIAMGFSQVEGAARSLDSRTLDMARNLFLPENAMSINGQAPTDDTPLPAGYVGWDWGYVHYSGLMLNAPQVQGRYQGQLEGSVIADYALFRLGHMNFKFDDRFNGQVPLPRLQTIKSTLGNHPRVIFDAGTCTNSGLDSWQCDANAVQ